MPVFSFSSEAAEYRLPITGRLISLLFWNLELVNLFTSATHELKIYMIATNLQLLHDEKQRKITSRKSLNPLANSAVHAIVR
jgi:hypothetical protein